MDFTYISEDPETGTMMYDADAVNRVSLLINSADWDDFGRDKSDDSDFIVNRAKSITIHPGYESVHDVS